MSPSIKLPNIGDTIDHRYAIQLCYHYNLPHLAERIIANPNKYKSWVFDGVSGLPDPLLGILNEQNWKDITYYCALPHDLAYAYGTPNDSNERKIADITFKRNLLINTKINLLTIYLFYYTVRLLGKQEFRTKFTWAFANVAVSEN